jgi:thiol-disulfide isomerase/thioredoxin
MKIFYTVILSLLCISATAQKKAEATINGNFPKWAGSTLTITGPNHFTQSFPVDPSGIFKATVDGPKGYYNMMHTGSISGYYVYVSPVANFTMSKSATDSVINFTGGLGSVQNTIISKLSAIARQYFVRENDLPSTMYFTEPTAFLAILDSYKTASLKAIDEEKSDAFFTKTQSDYIQYKVRYFTYRYTLKYGIDPVKEQKAAEVIAKAGGKMTRENMTLYMAAIDSAHVKSLSLDNRCLLEAKVWENFDVNNEELYKYDDKYRDLVSTRLRQFQTAQLATAPYLRAKSPNELMFDVVKKEITSSYIKQTLLQQYMLAMIKPDKDVEKYYADYKTIVTDPFYLDKTKQIYNNLKQFVAGQPSPDFAYMDVNGKTVTLSSLKGNYVYIDVWAQWCVPCKNEIPSLKEVEKKYGKLNIRFVSLSIDKMSEIDKWKDYVTENHLEGIQVIADNNWNSDFTRKYNINSIPRFILIDPEGNIVSADADRPSNPKLQTLFDQLLTKI